MKYMLIEKGRSKDPRQVSFFLGNALYLFKKPQSPLLYFYPTNELLSNRDTKITKIWDRKSVWNQLI